MIDYCKMRFLQVAETVKLNGMSKLLREIIYFNKVAIPVEMDLSNLRPEKDFVRPSNEQLIEITTEMMRQRSLVYPIRSRYLKAENYLKAGYLGFAMVKGDTVSGDIWCSASTNPKAGMSHPDEAWLSIRCQKNEVYTFDMYVNPESRGSNLAAALQNGALHKLRKKGFCKAYGFFWADNIPALWVHRILRWKELKKVKATRFILSRKLGVGRPT